MPPVKDVAPWNTSAMAEKANGDATPAAVRSQERHALRDADTAHATQAELAQRSNWHNAQHRGLGRGVLLMSLTEDVTQLSMPPVKDVALSNMAAMAERAKSDATQKPRSEANNATNIGAPPT